MLQRARDELVRSIYDAALDPSQWPAMLTRIARAVNCEQCNFVMSDPRAGTTQVITPMWREDDRASFLSHWHKEFTIAPKLQRFPVGRVIDYEELFDVDWLRRTDFYHQWWLPQGVGGGSLAANVLADGTATASITVHAPTTKLGFARKEEEVFRGVIGHLARSVTILRRLQMARLLTNRTEVQLASGFVVVDKYGAILHADAPTLSWLGDLGLLEASLTGNRINSGPVKALLLQAIEKVGGAQIDLRDQQGSRIQLSIIPCSPTDNFEPVVIDRPAALIWLVSLEQLQREKIDRVVNVYGLTSAEARIAKEACAGGGRAEIARRCGISPSTVRSHLEAIYSKAGVHKHAELVHLIEGI